MSLPYLPLYIDDYEADTAHLSLLEDGIYNRLLRLSWRTPGAKLPDDDAWIFRKLRATTKAEREAVLSVLAEFFKRSRGKVFSQRLVEVYVQVSVAHQKRKEAGKAGGSAKALKTLQSSPSNAKAMLKQPEPEPEPEVREDGGGSSASAGNSAGSDLEKSNRELILEAMGVGPDGVIGPSKFIGGQSDMAEVARWLALPSVTVDAACAEIRSVMAAKRDGPPSGFRYFTPSMQRLSGALSAAPLAPMARGSPHQSTAPPKRLWNLNPDDFNDDGSLVKK